MLGIAFIDHFMTTMTNDRFAVYSWHSVHLIEGQFYESLKRGFIVLQSSTEIWTENSLFCSRGWIKWVRLHLGSLALFSKIGKGWRRFLIPQRSCFRLTIALLLACSMPDRRHLSLVAFGLSISFIIDEHILITTTLSGFSPAFPIVRHDAANEDEQSIELDSVNTW